MTDETSQAIFGDAVAGSLEKPERPDRGLFGWKRPLEEKPPYTHCEDCGAELHGHYCSNCGQVAVDYRRSFRHVIADVAESFLNWDSKFTKTIGLLLICPGWLTNQFVAGRRTRYLHPLRLYLLVSIVFFLCARLIPVSPARIDLKPADRAKVEEALKGVPESVRAEIQRSLAEADKKAARKSSGLQAVPTVASTPEKKEVSPILEFDNEKGAFGKWLEQRAKEKIGEKGTKMEFFVDALRNNISTMMLFCIPLFALVLKILYLRQGRFYIEHLVYALHIHSFFYFAVLVIAFGRMAAGRWMPALEAPLTFVLVIAVAVQVFLTIRQVYRQSWRMTTFKFFFGGFVYLVVLFVAFAMTAFATVALP